MSLVFVHGNVFLSFSSHDEHGHHELAVRLFERAERGKVRLVTGPPVLFEVYWTLRSAYKLGRDEVFDAPSSILAAHGLTVLDHTLVDDATRRTRTGGVEFADAYIAASASAAGCTGGATSSVSDFRRLDVPIHPLKDRNRWGHFPRRPQPHRYQERPTVRVVRANSRGHCRRLE